MPIHEDGAAGTIRRLSWERRGTNNNIPRSGSIDSMVDAVWAETITSPEAPIPVAPIAIKSEKRGSLRPDRMSIVSPSVGRRMKGQRGVNGE